MSNMRVVYNNAADRASTITASSTAGNLTTAGLLTDAKSDVWRSTGPTAQLTVIWPTSEQIGVVALPFCSLSSGALIRIRGYANAGDTSPMFDTGQQMAAPPPQFDHWRWGADALGANAYSTPEPSSVNTYAYGGGSYGCIWFPIVDVQKLTIDIDDASSRLGYIEASRLVIGPYWEVINNAEFGVDVSMADRSVHQRSDAGDLITDRGILYKTMSLNLNFMPDSDRNIMWRIMRGNGMSKPIYLSLAPDSTDALEAEIFQIYGKLSRQSSIRYQFVSQYATQIEIEEI